MRGRKAGTMVVLAFLFLFLLSCSNNVYLPKNGTWGVRGKQFDTFSQAMSYLVACLNHEAAAGSRSRALVESDVPKDRTIFLLRDVGEYERGEAIVVPSAFKGELCIDFSEHEYWFYTGIDNFLEIRGGDRVDIINGTTVITEDTASRTEALIVGVRTVTVDDHLIDDRRKDPPAILVRGEGTLVITSSGTVSVSEKNPAIAGKLTIQEGGVLLIKGGATTFSDIEAETGSSIEITDGTVTIDAISNVDQGNFEITGGKIINPHGIAAIIDEAISAEHLSDVIREFIHDWVKVSETVISESTCHAEGQIRIHHKCSLCDAEYDEIVNTPKLEHVMAWSNDSHFHWAVCSLCGDVLIAKEPHTFVTVGDTTYCTVCGYVQEVGSGVQSGFDVTVEDLIPKGYLTLSELDPITNLYTVTLTSTNPNSEPDEFMWYVDDNLVEGETGTSIQLEYRYESFTVMVVFWNEKGTGSAELTIQ